MKTLQQIIERKDYVNINAALKKRAYELAEIIRSKFEELYPVWDTRNADYPEYAVDVENRRYTVKYNVYKDNGVRETEGTTLCVIDRECEWWSLENQPHRVYATNTPAAYFVQFLNDASAILNFLDEAETELVKECENAMSAAANL